MIKRLRRRRILIGLGLGLGLATLVAPAALAAGVHIRSVDTSGFPQLRATIVAPQGSKPPTLTENGHPVAGYTAVNLGDAKAIVLAVDRSESMSGRPFRNAMAAAESFVAAAHSGDHVGVVAFGHAAYGLTGSSESPADARAALAGLTVDTTSGTALYDAVVDAADQLAGDQRPGRAIVVVTDGADVSSTHTLQQAVDAAHAAHASIYTIGIGGPSFTPTALRALADRTGGSYRQASSAAALGSIYASLADELDRTWQVSYLTAIRSGGHVTLRARVPGAGSASATATLAASGGTSAGASSAIPSAGYGTAGTFALGLIVGLLVLLACCFWFASRRGNRLRSRIEPHLGTVEPTAVRRKRQHAAARQQVADGLERALGNLKYFQKVQETLERADLPLRAGELVTISAGAGVFCGLVAAVAALSSLVILLVMVVVASIPFIVVSIRARQRVAKFENQLPDLLITMAASLKAGHSFRQGIQAVVDEGTEPAAKEFRRVLTENQLGRPMDDALADLAERIGSKNLSFVINAVTIQRQIGGSLAGLFDIVAETVRQRQQFLRKVKGLTAMGRMSAYVLVGLPFALAAIITMMNPQFMDVFWNTHYGHMLIGLDLVMITIGSLVLKKIVSFKG
jgi:tight adherence protein B